jgi:hypothetical protein
MDQNFQTSFIPKKPMIEQGRVVKPSIGLFMIISIFLFFSMVIASGGAYFYKKVLTDNITKMKSDLILAKNRFEPSKIVQLKILDKRLISSDEILSKHITVSPIFEVLEALTMKTVRYTLFSYDFTNKAIVVKMSGQAIGYSSIALQADLFTKNKNLIDPIFSNLSLDDKGNVLFDLVFSVDPSFVNYKQVVKVSDTLLGDSPMTTTGIVN